MVGVRIGVRGPNKNFLECSKNKSVWSILVNLFKN